MKKRTDTDFVKQAINARRELANAKNPRKFDILKIQRLPRKVLNRTVVVAPESISLFNDCYDDFSRFIKDLERETERGRVLIDLKNVKSVKVSGILVLYANIEQLQKKTRTML